MTLIRFKEKPFLLELSRAAKRALRNEQELLYLQMELNISDNVYKRVVATREEPAGVELEWITRSIALCYRPLLSHFLAGQRAQYSEPIHKFQDKCPRWLKLEYDGRDYYGHFGFEQRQPPKTLALPFFGGRRFLGR